MALTQVTPDVVHNVQSNITQVGTLSNLTVTGNVTGANYNYANGVSITTPINSALSTLTSNAAVQSGLISAKANSANPEFIGNVTLSSIGARIQGDFSNSSYLSRAAFQTSTTNNNTALTVLPNGTGTASRIDLYANSDPTTSSYIALNATPSYFRILSSYNGPSDDSKFMPIEFHTGGQNRLTIDVGGNVIVEGGLTAANLTVTGAMQGPDGQVVTNNGSTWDIDIYGQAGSATTAGYATSAGSASTATTATNALSLGGTPAAQYLLTSATAVTVSGASVNFTSIPSWAKRITVMFSGVSTSGSSNMLVRLGTSASVEATGYLGSQSGADAVGGIVASLETTGFRVSVATASTSIIHGTITLTYIGSNIWTATGITSRSNAAYITYLGGSKTLASTLTRVQITMANGTDTFDAGTINIMYE